MGLFSFFKEEEILYVPDSSTIFKNKNGYELYLKIFSKLDIPVIILDKAIFVGREALEAGYESVARKTARENFDLLKSKSIKKIITTSPECYKMFVKNYKELIPDWDINVENIWRIILDKLEKNPKAIKNKADEAITFHDNCYLGRYCKIYEEPRKILELLGYEIKEMDNNRENSFCCGSCGGLPLVDKELADNLAQERLLQAKRIKMNKMIVCSFDNYNLLKENNKISLQILELSEVLADALGIEIFKEEINESINQENQVQEINTLEET